MTLFLFDPVNFLEILFEQNNLPTYLLSLVYPLLALPLVVAIYPLDKLKQGQDISGNRSPTGKLVGVKSAPGPDGRSDGATQFLGNANSYIDIPNTNAKLDAMASMTILAWVYHEGISGPIFNYRRGPGWGVHLWLVTPRTLFVRFLRRDGKFTAPLSGTRIRLRYRAWNYVGATYDYRTGIARLWLNARLIAEKKIGRHRLATNYPVRIGARVRDSRYFKGRISCVQIFSKALNSGQIKAAAKTCFRSCKLL